MTKGALFWVVFIVALLFGLWLLGVVFCLCDNIIQARRRREF